MSTEAQEQETVIREVVLSKRAVKAIHQLSKRHEMDFDRGLEVFAFVGVAVYALLSNIRREWIDPESLAEMICGVAPEDVSRVRVVEVEAISLSELADAFAKAMNRDET